LVLILSAALALLSGSLAYAISSRRDVGAGAFPTRAGPASASRILGGPIGLAWRLQRASLLGWSAGLAMFGVVYGSVANSVGELLNENPQLAQIVARLGGQQGLTDAFFSTATGVLALIAAAYSIRTALRLQAEEDGIRAEPVLSTATSRLRWAASHLIFAVLGPALMMLVAGFAMGATYGAIMGDIGGQGSRVMGAALIQVPAVWVLTGATAALYGFAPRLTVMSWGFLVICLLLGLLGQILGFPQWLIDLSPFTHVQALRAADANPAAIAALLAIGAGLTGAGLIGFRRRDLVAA
jgi:ABC-2 type transport system permease protein